MASTQFDGSVLRAMQLLHSPNKEATEELKAIFEESLAQKKAPNAVPIQKPAGLTVKPASTNRQSAQVLTSILIATDGLRPSSCTVCKRSEQRSGNEIFKCQECHKPYHRECHKPGLENENVKDIRFVWYCSACTNKRKRIKLIQPKQPPSFAANSPTHKEAKESQNAESGPFKSRLSMKK